MTASAWFIGSITLPQQSLEIGGAPAVVASDTAYLRSATASLSWLSLVAAAASTLTGDTHTIVVLRNRRIQWSATGGNWDVDFNAGGAGLLIRALFGFTQDTYSGAASYTAETISPLLWSPGYLATPKTIAGVTGYTIPHQSIRKSADGTQVQCDHYGEETWQDLSWTHIMPERMRTNASVAGQGGTFHQFFQQCAMLRRRFLYHEEIDEDDASTSAVSWSAAMGAYVLRPDIDGDWYRRNVPFAEVSSPLDLPMHLVAEYS